jgi:hypothetical protein
MQCHVEGEAEPVLVEPEEILPEQEMPRAGDGQELRETLHHPEYYSFDKLEQTPSNSDFQQASGFACQVARYEKTLKDEVLLWDSLERTSLSLHVTNLLTS